MKKVFFLAIKYLLNTIKLRKISTSLPPKQSDLYRVYDKKNFLMCRKFLNPSSLYTEFNEHPKS